MTDIETFGVVVIHDRCKSFDERGVRFAGAEQKLTVDPMPDV